MIIKYTKVVGQPTGDPASTVRLRTATTIAAMSTEYRKYTSENSTNPSVRLDLALARSRSRTPTKHFYLSRPRKKQHMEPNSNDKWREIRPIVDELEHLRTDGRYIFRGEAKEFPNISSSLRREQELLIELGTPFEPLDLEEQRLAKAYVNYANPEYDEQEVMSHIQHYGGKTNFVDFTKNPFKALFFASDGYYSEDGRIAILKNENTETHQIHQPNEPKERTDPQESIFVIPKDGIVREWEAITIAANHKHQFRNYLVEEKNISLLTMYSGPHGFIKYRERHWKAIELSKKGATEIEKNEFTQAEESLQDAINQEPFLATPYYLMGLVKGLQEEYSNAIEYLTKGLEVAEPGGHAGFLIAIGDTKANAGNYESAIEAYTQALEYPMPVNGTKNGQAYCYYARGMVNRFFRNHNDAISDLREAVKLTEHTVENGTLSGIERLPLSAQREFQAIQEELLEVHTKAKEALKNLLSEKRRQ